MNITRLAKFIFAFLLVLAISQVLNVSQKKSAKDTMTFFEPIQVNQNDVVPAPSPITATLSLAAVGDIMTSRVVGQKMIKHGYDYPFLETTSLFSDQDLVFANLETPLVEGPPVSTGTMVFRSDPEAATAIKKAGFDVISLANNHTMNKGSTGLVRTFEVLQESNLQWMGAGHNETEARSPLLFEQDGIKVAFLAYTDTDVIPTSYAATSEKPGVNVMNIANLKEDITAVRPQADFVIISLHSGTEYVVEPNSRQTEYAHAAIDAGADLVLGHHPHVVQQAEVYKDCFIFYSLGNFVFDQMWSQDTKEGLAVFLELQKTTSPDHLITKEITLKDLQPVQIDDYAQPHPITDVTQKERILNRLGDYSALLTFSN